MDDKLRVGVYTNTHGVHGEIKVYPTTDDAKHLKKVKEVYLGKEKRLLHLKTVRPQNDRLIFSFAEFENRNDVEALRKQELFVARKDASPLSEDEYYVSAGHSMTKGHYLSFIAYVTGDRFEMKALYPEGPADAYFFRRGGGWLYWYCNRHGLFRQKLER